MSRALVVVVDIFYDFVYFISSSSSSSSSIRHSFTSEDLVSTHDLVQKICYTKGSTRK